MRELVYMTTQNNGPEWLLELGQVIDVQSWRLVALRLLYNTLPFFSNLFKVGQ